MFGFFWRYFGGFSSGASAKGHTVCLSSTVEPRVTVTATVEVC